MYKTRDEWLTLIRDQKTPRSFAGTTPRIPSPGDMVRVVRGTYTGASFTVVAVTGPVYSIAQEVYVDVPGDVPMWFHPWDIEVLPAQPGPR